MFELLAAIAIACMPTDELHALLRTRGFAYTSRVEVSWAPQRLGMIWRDNNGQTLLVTHDPSNAVGMCVQELVNS